MTPRITIILGFLTYFVAFAGSANATTFDFGGVSGDSLHGATGSLTIDDLGGGDYDVTWSMDFTGYEGSDGNHKYLTEVAWKVTGFDNITALALDDPLDDPLAGEIFWPSNVNNGGCDSSSPADFACVTLTSDGIDATTDGSFSVVFNVEADGFDPTTGVSYRGAFGPENGWVISEGAGSVVPEPTAAVVFGLGMLVMGSHVRRQRR
jgi:hypothetical protein